MFLTLLLLFACTDVALPPSADTSTTEDVATAAISPDDLAAEAPPPQAPAALLEVEPAALDFGAQRLGAQVSSELYLRNLGDATLVIEQADLHEGSHFRLGTLPLPVELAPGEVRILQVRYSPTTPNDRDTLTLATDVLGAPRSEVPLSGHLAWPELVVTPEALDVDLASWCVATPAAITLRNDGELMLHISEVSAPSGLTLSETGPLFIPPGGERVVFATVEDYIQASGGEIVFYSDVPSGPVAIPIAPLDGGGSVELSPTALDFGVSQYSCDDGEPLHVRNTSACPLMITGVELPVGVELAPWSIPLPVEVGPGSEQLLQVMLDSHVGDLHGVAIVRTSVGDLSVPLSAWEAAPVVVASDLRLALGADCTFSDTLRITNQGPGCVTLSGVDLPPGLNAPAAWPTRLAEGESIELTVDKDTLESAVQGEAYVLTDSSSGDAAFHVATEGPTPYLVDSASLDFGATPVSCDAGETLRVRNASTCPLALTSVELPPGVELAPWSPQLPATVAPLGEQVLQVVLRGDGSGIQDVATLRTSMGDLVVPVSALPAAPVVVASDLDLGPSSACPSSGAITLTNQGPGCVTLTGMQLPDALSVRGAWPVQLSEGETLELVVDKDSRAAAIDADVAVVTDSLAGDAHFRARTVGPAPGLVLSTRSIDFGGVCPVLKQPLELASDGTGCVQVSGADLPVGVRFSDATPAFPFMLHPGDAASLELELDFQSSFTEEILTVYSTAPEAETRVQLLLEPDPSTTLPRESVGVELLPAVLDFGSTQRSCDAGELLTVRNAGSCTMVVTSLDLPEGVEIAPWSAPLPAALAPGGERRLRLILQSDGAGLQGTAVLHTTSGNAVLPVQAEPAAPVVIAQDLDLGPSTACTASGAITLTNQGPGCAKLTGVQLPEGISTRQVWPLQLAEGETRQLLLEKSTIVAKVDAAAAVLTDSPAGDAPFHVSTRGPAPSLVMSAPVLDFAEGASSVCRPTPQTVSLRTDGTGCVQVTGVDLPPGVGVAGWSRPFPYTLRPGDSSLLGLTFNPSFIRLNDAVQVHSNAAGGLTPLPVLYEPVVANVTPRDTVVDFGSVGLGCEASSAVTFDVTGPGCVYINPPSVSPGTRVTSAPPLAPSTYVDGEDFVVELAYTGQDTDYVGVFELNVGPPVHDVSLPLLATYDAPYFEPYSDVFEQSLDDMVDIVMWIDESSTMNDNQGAINAAVCDISEGLAARGLDFHLLVASADGCGVGGVLQPSTPSFHVELMQGFEYSDTSHGGMYSLRRALEESAPGGCNAGFMRPGATTNAILLSAVPDASARGWSAELNDALGHTDKLVVHALSEKRGTNTGYLDASSQTRGSSLLVDDGWTAALQLALRSMGQGREVFVLSNGAVGDTVSVSVDGVPLTQGWTFQANLNAVVFDSAAVPGPGHVIVIDYEGDPGACF